MSIYSEWFWGKSKSVLIDRDLRPIALIFAFPLPTESLFFSRKALLAECFASAPKQDSPSKANDDAGDGSGVGKKWSLLWTR
jgi:hypothetical protein